MASEPENTASSTEKRSLLWWRHEYYRSRWKQWYENWRKLLCNSPATGEDSPRTVLDKLSSLGGDPEIAVRLAFLVASHKPLTQSELAKDTRRQQRLRRKLRQAGQRLLDSARLLEEAANDFPLIFIGPEQINAATHIAQLCGHEFSELLEPRALELPSGHELFTLSCYVKAATGKQNHKLVTDLLDIVYRADRQRGPTQDSLEKQVQRFASMDSIYPDEINEDTSKRVNSGELKEDFLACFPGEIFPDNF
jgi:hypothetical protein